MPCALVRTRACYLPVLNTVPMLELAAVNWFGGYLVLHHRLSIGLLVAFNAYLASLTGPPQFIDFRAEKLAEQLNDFVGLGER